jgi:hypothetical protein
MGRQGLNFPALSLAGKGYANKAIKHWILAPESDPEPFSQGFELTGLGPG